MDHQQITFVTLTRFFPLSQNPPLPQFLTDNIKLEGISTKIKLEMLACLTLQFKIQLPVLISLVVLHQFLYQQILFLELFRTSFSFIKKKIFFLVTNFFFLEDSTIPSLPHPINGQNLTLIKDSVFNVMWSIKIWA